MGIPVWVQCCAKVLEWSGQRHYWDRALGCSCWEVTGITTGQSSFGGH